MIPATNGDIATVEISEKITAPSQTFEIDFEKKTIKGTIDGVQALKQSVFCTLMTIRGESRICEDDDGFPLFEILGQSAPLVYVLIANTITETLLRDDRILSVDNFIFDTDRKAVTVSFSVKSVFGNVNFEEVSL